MREVRHIVRSGGEPGIIPRAKPPRCPLEVALVKDSACVGAGRTRTWRWLIARGAGLSQRCRQVLAAETTSHLHEGKRPSSPPLFRLLSLHVSPIVNCGGGYGPVCCVTLGPASPCSRQGYAATGRPFANGLAQDKPSSTLASACPEASRRVASLADTAICAASPFDIAQDRSRPSVRDAG